MKNNVIRMFLAVSAASGMATALHAQTPDFSAKVPFAFQAAGKVFAAGNYLVREHGYLGIPSMQNAATGDTAFVAGSSHTLTRVGPTRLVFHCYAGNTCFLAEIRPSIGPGIAIAMTKVEKGIANGDQPREVAAVAVDLHHGE